MRLTRLVASSVLLVVSLVSGQMLDSLNTRTVGCWPYGNLDKGGVRAFPPYCPVAESFLYVAAGRGMYVLDVSNPAAVTKVDSFAKPGGELGWFSVSGNYCLTGQAKSGVALYDIHDRRHPALVSTHPTPWFPKDGQIIGQYGFIVGDELKILDFTDPHNPVELGSCPTPEKTDAVFISGDYAYLAANYEGFIVIDIHDLTNPFEVFRYKLPSPPYRAARDIQVRDTLAFIAWEDGGLRIWNVKDPTAPFEVGVYAGQISGVKVADTIAYINRTRSYEYDSMYIISVADPTQPRALGKSRGTSAAVLGNRCYLLNPWSDSMPDDTLSILDVSDPQNPALLGTYSQFHAMTDGLFVQGDFAYAATRGQGLKVYDVSNPSAPRLLSRLGSYLVNQAWVSPDNIAYLACWEGPVFRIADVSDPQNPVLLSTIDTTCAGHAVSVDDTLAFLSFDNNVWVINVADPRAPRRIGVIASGGDTPWHCAVDGEVLFVPYPYVDGNYYLRIYGISDPTQPESLCFYNTQVAVSDVEVRYPYIYLVGSQFIVLDISNPREPKEVARCPVIGYGQSIALDGKLAYIAESYDGVYAYDVSNPAEPIEVGFYVTPTFANEVQVRNGLVYIADSNGWLVLEHYESGIADSHKQQAASHKPMATVVRGVLFLPMATGHRPQAASLLDISGRKALDLKPGANDVSRLAPGVYFIREGLGTGCEGLGKTRKVVITR